MNKKLILWIIAMFLIVASIISAQNNTQQDTAYIKINKNVNVLSATLQSDADVDIAGTLFSSGLVDFTDVLNNYLGQQDTLTVLVPITSTSQATLSNLSIKQKIKDVRLINNLQLVDLNEFFYDEDNDTLTYDYSPIDGIDVTITDGIVNLKNVGATGIRQIRFSANDGIDTTFTNWIKLQLNETLVAEPSLIPINIFDDEQWAYYYWKKAQFEGRIGNDNVLVHLDKHPDNGGVFKLPDNLLSLKDVSNYVDDDDNVEDWNFISAAIYDGTIKEIYWLVPEFVETTKDTVWKYKLEDEGLELLEPEDATVSDYDVVVHVINSPTQIPSLENENVLLGIDIDYFLFSDDKRDIKRNYSALNVKINDVMRELKRLNPKSITISKDRLDNVFVRFMVDSLKLKLNDILVAKNLNSIVKEEMWDYRKLKDDPIFDVTIKSSEIQNENLVVIFSHDSDAPQPIKIIGDVNYILDKEISQKDEDVTLTVFNYNNENFRLRVGLESEEYEFGPPPVITFDRNLDCHRCGKHKAPPLTSVNMTIIADVTGTVIDENLTDYYPNEWTVTDTNGGIVTVINETYSKIEWNISANNETISRSYKIKSPQRTLPPTNYYFYNELVNQSSGLWRVIVSDPTVIERLDVDAVVQTGDFSPCVASDLTDDDGTNFCTAGGTGKNPVNWLNATLDDSSECTGTVSDATIFWTARETGGPEKFIIHYSDNGADTDETGVVVTTSFAIRSYDVSSFITTCTLANQAQIWVEAAAAGRNDGTNWDIDEVFLNITYTTVEADNTPPFFPTDSINNSAPKINEVVGIGQNATDAGSSISMVIFAHNQSGIMVNVSNTSVIDVKSINYTPNITVTLGKGEVIGYTFWANDTSTDTTGGNVNTTDATEGFRTFTVVNTDPTQPNIVNATNRHYINNITINITPSTDADSDTLTYFWFRNTTSSPTPVLLVSGTTVTNLTTTISDGDGTYWYFVNVSDGEVNVTGDLWNWTLDTTVPVINATLNESLTNIGINDVINLTANATDNLGLSFGQIIVNDTGSVRTFSFDLGGATSAEFSQNITVACNGGCVINFTARVNDTAGNFKTNDTIITIADKVNPVVNATLNKSLTSINQNDVINITANATDNIGLSFGQIIVNDTGGVRFYNFSLGGSTGTIRFSQNITISCGVGCVINFTARVNDTSNRFTTNDTIIEVQSAADAPVIKLNNVSTFTVNPKAGDSVEILISFNVTDSDGVATINASKAIVNLTLGPRDVAQFRYNISDQGGVTGTCGNYTDTGPEPDVVVINCTILMRYYDNASSDWVINVSIEDTSGLVGRNDTITFTYNDLAAFSLTRKGLSESGLNFTSLNLGNVDKPGKTPILLNNTGNNDFDQINITAADLISGSNSIGVGNFTINVTNGTAGLGLRLTLDAQVIRDLGTAGNVVANATLLHGPGISGDSVPYPGVSQFTTKGNLSLFFWVDIPFGLATGTYNNTWNITVIDLT